MLYFPPLQAEVHCHISLTSLQQALNAMPDMLPSKSVVSWLRDALLPSFVESLRRNVEAEVGANVLSITCDPISSGGPSAACAAGDHRYLAMKKYPQVGQNVVWGKIKLTGVNVHFFPLF